ncbi:hypothetical protein B0T10DRAFT_96558 [Thelonectria olida]|uniref:Uncharacterized protein n=1 Tax=Thelonectria olida TaxID=1576542 RepID=A0A9P8VXX5_9HYPO|nr:hypothetical protein B0T10DRAFT_96558 [Thelonectria olida]
MWLTWLLGDVAMIYTYVMARWRVCFVTAGFLASEHHDVIISVLSLPPPFVSFETGVNREGSVESNINLNLLLAMHYILL